MKSCSSQLYVFLLILEWKSGRAIKTHKSCNVLHMCCVFLVFADTSKTCSFVVKLCVDLCLLCFTKLKKCKWVLCFWYLKVWSCCLFILLVVVCNSWTLNVWNVMCVHMLLFLKLCCRYFECGCYCFVFVTVRMVWVWKFQVFMFIVCVCLDIWRKNNNEWKQNTAWAVKLTKNENTQKIQNTKTH